MTSMCKLSEIFSRAQITLPQDAWILAVGEGQGGFVAYLLTRYERGVAVLNDRIADESHYMAYTPTEALNMHVLNRTSYHQNAIAENDITLSGCQAMLSLQVHSYLGGTVDLFTCDAEATSDVMNGAILRACIESMNRCCPTGCMEITKSYISKDREWLIELSRLSKAFHSCAILRLESTRPATLEIYVLGVRFRPVASLSHQPDCIASVEWVSALCRLHYQIRQPETWLELGAPQRDALMIIASDEYMTYYPVFPGQWMTDQCGVSCAERLCTGPSVMMRTAITQ